MHCFFPYIVTLFNLDKWYFAENKSSVGEGASLIDDCGNLGKKKEHSYVLQYGVGIASAGVLSGQDE